MEAKIKEMLEAPFKPEEIKQRVGSYGKKLDYIEYTSIVKRLNSLNVPWSFRVISHSIAEDECICLGELTLDIDGGITKHGFGSKKITRNAEGKALNIGDDYKSSSSSALRKAASLLGCGLYLYDSLAEEAQGQKKEEPKSNGSNGNGSNGSSANNGNGATNAQLRAITNLCRRHNIGTKEQASLLKEVAGVSSLPELNKGTASLVIQKLQTFQQSAA